MNPVWDLLVTTSAARVTSKNIFRINPSTLGSGAFGNISSLDFFYNSD